MIMSTMTMAGQSVSYKDQISSRLKILYDYIHSLNNMIHEEESAVQDKSSKAPSNHEYKMSQNLRALLWVLGWRFHYIPKLASFAFSKGCVQVVYWMHAGQ